MERTAFAVLRLLMTIGAGGGVQLVTKTARSMGEVAARHVDLFKVFVYISPTAKLV